VKHNRIDPTAEGPPGEGALSARLVADHMVARVTTIGRDETVEAAWRRMRARGIRHLPVVGPEERLVGIVTDRDLRHVMLDPARRGGERHPPVEAARQPVERIMTRSVVTVRADTDLRQAARLMHERRIGALPVLDDADRVVGLLTETDVLRAFVDVLGERAIPPGMRWLMRPVSHSAQARRSAGSLVG
jgi:acetoin utilization protein AcuB